MNNFDVEHRKIVIGGVAVFIITVYIIRLFALQLMSDDYRKSADSNAFLKKVEYPSRGIIRDRNGKFVGVQSAFLRYHGGHERGTWPS